MVVVFVIHWHESAMDLHIFPIPIPPPTSLSTQFLWVFPVHLARALVSCIQPGLVICFTLDNIHVLMMFSRNSVGEGEGGLEFYIRFRVYHGLPRWLSGKKSTGQHRRCRNCRFDPWVGMIAWSRKWQPTLVFLPGEPCGQRSLVGYSP